MTEISNSPTFEVNVANTELVSALRNDFNFFAAFALGEIHTSDFPPEYIALYAMLAESACNTEQIDFKYGIGLPRGHAKTTTAKLFLAWCFLFTHREFALVTCGNEAKAQAFCSDVMLILSAPNVRTLFGNWETDAEKNSASRKIFTINGKNCILQAVGAGGDPRGANIKFRRPDIQICDDIQSRSNAKSVAESKSLYDWYNSTLYFTKAPTGVLHIFIANMYPFDGSILKKLQANPGYVTLIVGAILKDGTALWPQIANLEALRNDYRTMVAAGTPEIFISEILNCADSFSTLKFDAGAMHAYDVTDSHILHGSFIVVDPAGDSAGADDTSIGVYFVLNEIVYLRKMIAKRMTPLETIETAVQLAMEFKIFNVFSERVGYQKSLIFWATKYLTDNKISSIVFRPIDRNNRSKNPAILDAIGYMQSGKYSIHPEYAGIVLYQISQFDPDKRGNKDDILDNIAYSIQVIAQHANSIIPAYGEVVTNYEPVRIPHSSFVSTY